MPCFPLTRTMLATTAAARWYKQYGLDSEPMCQDDTHERAAFKHAHGVYEALCALGISPDADDVDRIIGNNSWTHAHCSGCGDYVATGVMQVGQLSEYESEMAYLCGACLTEAYGLAQKHGIIH